MGRLLAVCVVVGWTGVASAQDRGSTSLVEPPPEVAATGTFRALLFSATKYEHWPSLQAPARDVDALRKVLTEQYLFEPENTKVVRDPTEDQIHVELRAFAASAAPADSLLVYFAGHGWEDPHTHNGYWVPSNAREGTVSDYVSTRDVRDVMSRTKALHVAVVADSCFSGALVTRSARAPRTGYAKRFRRRSFEAMSSGAREPVPDAGANGHSPFAFYLIQALERPERPLVALEDAYDRVKHGVKSYSPQEVMYGHLTETPGERGGFVFIPRNRGEGVVVPSLPASLLAQSETEEATVRARPGGGGGYWPWVVFGTGLATAAGGGALLALAHADAAVGVDGGVADDTQAEYQDRWDSARTSETVGWVLVGAGTAAAVGGLVWALSSRDGVAARPAPRVWIGIAANGGMLGGRF